MRTKLGLADAQPEDEALIGDLLTRLRAQRAGYTAAFRTLSSAALGDTAPARTLFTDPTAFDAWSARWRARLASETRDPQEVAAAMDRGNPVYKIGRASCRGRVEISGVGGSLKKK